MGRLTRLLALAGVILAFSTLTTATLLLEPPVPASAHDERPPVMPDGRGSVPVYRPTGAAQLVCKTDKNDFERRVAVFPAALRTTDEALWTQCQKSGFRNLQDAVNAVTQPGSTIKVLPGVYLEEPSLAAPPADCANLVARPAALGYPVLSYHQQVTCPNLQNLVAILGKDRLQIEGMGAAPTDVVLDARFRKLNALRADRSPGIYLRNFTVQHTNLEAVYIVESDGFAIDQMVGRWNDQFGFLAFADDHGLVTDCEAYGNGYAGISAQTTADLNRTEGADVTRYAAEIRRCRSHDNLIGFAGTAANSVLVHDNTFTANSVGVATDSAFADQPGQPQNHATFEHNVMAENNADYYGYVRNGTCRRPSAQRGYDQGVVCPAVGVPVGTGIANAGGNDDSWFDNRVYGNRYAGVVTWWVPGYVRGDDRVVAQFDTAHRDRWFDNTMGRKENGVPAANGMDVWWDGEGAGSCWQSPSGDGSEPPTVPRCDADDQPAEASARRYVAEPAKALKMYVCSHYDLATASVPADCDWYGATGLQRVEVKWSLGEAVLLGLLMIILWWRTLRGRGTLAALLGLLLGLAGLVVGVEGTLRETSPLASIGLALLGAGWLLMGAALPQRGRAGLGWLTIVMAVFALAGAVDRSVLVIPYLPVPPSVVRILLEVIWVPWSLVAAIRGRLLAGAGVDPLERYTERLWY